ncbi:MAG: hypothetical protein AAGA65_30520 [Actinomycetota bacterium]
MTDDHELTEQLTRMGRAPTAEVDPAFADRLDAHLRVRHVEVVGGRPDRWPIGRLLIGTAGATVVMVVLLSLTVFRTSQPVVIMTAAAGTDVVLPGEAPSPGAAGQELPDGTRIVVADDGEAVVGGVVLGPGSEALVVSGRIEILDLSGSDRPDPPDDALPETSNPVVSVGPTGDDTTTTSVPDGSDDRTPTTAVDRPSDGDRDEADRDGDSDRTDSTTTPTTPSSTPTTNTDTSGTTTTSTSAGPPPSDRPTTSVTDREPTVELTAESVGADRVFLMWNPSADADPRSWRIEAVSGDRTVTLVVLRDGSARTTTVARIDARRVGFRVVAVDADGQDVVSSELVAQPSAP